MRKDRETDVNFGSRDLWMPRVCVVVTSDFNRTEEADLPRKGDYSIVYFQKHWVTVLWDLLGNGEENSSEIEYPGHFCLTGPEGKVLLPVTVALLFGKDYTVSLVHFKPKSQAFRNLLAILQSNVSHFQF